MNVFQFVALLCALAGAVVGAMLGFSIHPLMSVGGFFGGGAIGLYFGPYLALGFFLVATLVCEGPRSFVFICGEIFRRPCRCASRPSQQTSNTAAPPC